MKTSIEILRAYNSWRTHQHDRSIKMNDELLKEKKKFYLIWCATKHVGTHKHFTFKEAEKEAVRLAKINPGESFVILESKAFAKIEKPTEVFYYE